MNDPGVSFLRADGYLLAYRQGHNILDAPESTRQLWTLKLKISKDRRKGGVDPVEFAFTTFTIDWGLASVWADVVLMGLVTGRLENALRIRSHWLAMQASS